VIARGRRSGKPGRLLPFHEPAPRPIERLVPIGKGAGGDIFFLDPGFRRGEPVLRCVHDEGPTFRVEASSLGAYVAAFALQGLAEQGRVGGASVDEDTLRALVDADRARVGG
jgi:hypothetical protein